MGLSLTLATRPVLVNNECVSPGGLREAGSGRCRGPLGRPPSRAVRGRGRRVSVFVYTLRRSLLSERAAPRRFTLVTVAEDEAAEQGGAGKRERDGLPDRSAPPLSHRGRIECPF
ncbi:hypothetical protein SKAU_G00145760 [Synaphobranchus kaupii]|uniref:Uncharacterized protein n=1 Tax=Synaphobranchus kaupii TaxID=118154 RepID=A0A9Q1FU36_SYNKA|nr:hypothetical protein SKAU_G00145760 [Synaphobranchus kaupii]